MQEKEIKRPIKKTSEIWKRIRATLSSSDLNLESWKQLEMKRSPSSFQERHMRGL